MTATAGLIGLPSHSKPLRIGCEPPSRKGFAGPCYVDLDSAGARRLCAAIGSVSQIPGRII
jgi:hypothetical protein